MSSLLIKEDPSKLIKTRNCKYFASKQFFCLVLYLLLYNSFLDSGDFCCLLINFANSLDPDQDQQEVGPDLDPKHLTL